MRTDTTQHSVLVIGRSQLVIDDTVAGMRELGYEAEATNDFLSNIADRFDARKLDVVVLGGQVPPERKAELEEEIGAINPRVTFVHGLAGIPGLLINQVQAAFAPGSPDPVTAPSLARDGQSIRLTLAGPVDVKVTAWWHTSFVPPHPRSDSRVLLDERLAAGDHSVPVPEHVPTQGSFATVRIGPEIHAFSMAGGQ
jgi:hypothetical protein